MITSPTTRGVDRLRRSVSSILIQTVGTKLSTRLIAVWGRGKGKASHPLGNPPPETRTAHESIHRLPHELVEMIIAHLTRDFGDLKACSLTCRSWYIAAIPHLYHTLTLMGTRPDVDLSQLKPLFRLHELGLLSFVKELRVAWWPNARCRLPPLFPIHFDLRNFSALTNVHTLKIQDLELYHFISDIELHFGQFSQTLRSITLYDPYCTPRQLSHFLSLFSNLDNVGIWDTSTYVDNRYAPDATVPDKKLVQFSTPKLQGRVALYYSGWVETWTRLASCGGLRFRHADLRGSAGSAQVLLKACAETLETLRITATDATGFDLSQLKVLRSLQIDLSSSGYSLIAATNPLSTLASPVFSELVIGLEGYLVPLPWVGTLSGVLRRVNEARCFKLVFLFEASDFFARRQNLAKSLDSVTASGLFDFLDSPPIVRIVRPSFNKWDLLDPY